MKTVIITGWKGFIGSHVTLSCLNKGWKVLGYDKCTRVSLPNSSGIIRSINSCHNFSSKDVDICDLEYIPDCDYIINVAAESHVGNSIIDCQSFIRSNIDGVRNILTLINNKPSNVRKRPILLHFSTDEVYGDTVDDSFTENCMLNPSNPYAASKSSADMLIKSWHRTYGTEYIIVRPTNNYGKYQYPEKLIPLCVKLIESKHKVRLHDQGEPIRSWLHVEDTSDAIMKIIESGVTNEIYNIGSNEEIKNIEVATMIVNSLEGRTDVTSPLSPVRRKMYFELNYTRPGQDVRYSVDDSKLRALGWKPKRKFSKHIYEIVQHYKSNWRW